MAHTPGSCAPSLSRRARALTLLSVAVVLVHGAVLHGAPLLPDMALAPSTPDVRPFSTRTINPQPQAATLAEPLAPRRAEIPRLPAPPRNTARNAEIQGKMAPEPTQQAQDATENIANSSESDTATVQLASATPAAPNMESVPAVSHAPPAATVASQAAPAVPATAPRHLLLPGPARLKYGLRGEIKGIPYSASGELLWLHDSKNYEARLEISVFLLGSKVQTSKGELTPQGLAPIRFGDKYRSEVAAHFERSKGKVSFSANTPDVPLQPDAQDQVSAFMQLAALVGGDPDRFPPGMKLSFQAVGPRYAEQWAFAVGVTEMLDLPGGKVKAIRFTRESAAEFDTRGDVWLAPEMDYLPVRIRLTQANGDFLDLLWKSTEKP